MIFAELNGRAKDPVSNLYILISAGIGLLAVRLERT
jgi:hypothetical protein